MGGESVIINCAPGMTMDDAVIAAGRCSVSQHISKVYDGPEFLDGQNSGGPGVMPHLPRIHSGRDPLVWELGDMLCLSD